MVMVIMLTIRVMIMVMMKMIVAAMVMSMIDLVTGDSAQRKARLAEPSHFKTKFG